MMQLPYKEKRADSSPAPGTTVEKKSHEYGDVSPPPGWLKTIWCIIIGKAM